MNNGAHVPVTTLMSSEKAYSKHQFQLFVAMLVLAKKQEYIVDQPASNVRTISPMCQLRTHK